MYDSFIHHINTNLPTKLTKDEIELIKSTFVPKKLLRHQFLLEKGKVCNVVGFIVKGALKQYTIDESGKENVIGLFLENWWAGDRESYTNRIPSPYYIDAFEETDMLALTMDVYNKRLSNERFMKEVLQTLYEKKSNKLLKRVVSATSQSAEQRLADLESSYPEFLQRFPQHIIASYLGMTKETMSRIRAKPLKKR